VSADRKRSVTDPAAATGAFGTRHPLALPATLLALGLVSTLLLIGTDWIRERQILQDIARIHALGTIQHRLATAHLWMEELVTGDEVHLDDIFTSLEEARRLGAAMLGTAPATAGGHYRIQPLREPALRRSMRAVADGLDHFTELSRRRQQGYAAAADVGIGSAIDSEYDRLFQQVMGEALALDTTIGERMLVSHTRSRWLFRTVLAAWVLLVALAVTGLATRERRRARAETELRQREKELFQARKMEAVGRLAGGIAHDINNYLAAINAQCERLQMKAEPDSPLAQRLQRITDTCFKASALIKQLLAFTRRRPVKLEVLNFNRTLDELVPMMRRLLGEDIRLETRLEPGLWNVEMDPSQLEQVIVNLLVNAREAMPASGTVSLTTANREAAEGAGESVELAVADTGTGIPPEIRDKLFEPFFTTKESTGGSGLGLATVYGVVTRAGGTVRVESEVGRGSRFEIVLPRSLEPETAGNRLERMASRPQGGDERILLVDDNEEFRQSTAAILGSLGYRVTEAGNGDEALVAWQTAAGGFDLVVSDIRMPGTSGPELGRTLRGFDGAVKLLFISGSTGASLPRHGFDPEEVEILHKPFTALDLDRRLRRLIDGPGPTGAGTAG